VNWSALRLLFIHEMRMVLRSPRTIAMSLVLPAVLMPAMILGARWIQEQQTLRLDQTTFDYMVTGPWADRARLLIETYRNAAEFRDFHIRETRTPDPDRALYAGTLHFYIRTLSVEDADRELDKAPEGVNSVPAQDSPSIVTGVPGLQVVYRGSQAVARRGAERMIDMMRVARRNESYSIMESRGFPSHPEGILATTADNLATESQVSGSNLGRFFTVVLVVWLVAAGSIAAMDIIAGEKERGTLETLITSGAGRTEIATAKHLAIWIVGLTITLMQVFYAWVYIRLNVIQLPPGFSINLSGSSIVQLFALFVPLAAAIAAALLIISAFARTYKEAQLHFFPFFMGSLVPALAAVVPGLKSRSIIAFVPLANVSVAAREVLMGRPDPLMIAVIVAVMGLLAMALIRYSARLLAREDIVVSAQHEQSLLEGGEAHFRKRVFRWFAVMWAVTFAVAANVPQLQTPRAQILFNEVVIFLGGSVLMLHKYRLNVREVLGIRRLPWQVWAAVLAAVPASQVVAVAFFRIVSTVIPTPTDLLRQLGRQVAPEGLPMWQIYVFMAFLPAVCEELAFRGLLLHGLRHRFHPVVRCLVVGVVFGLFHYTLFRIAPTALLGVILTAIALMTGSIFPGLLFHVANNSLAIGLGTAGVSMSRFDWYTYATAVGVFALSMHTIWRYGRRREPSPLLARRGRLGQ
jgi:ABC-type Na+ efflux pump permease subunit/membrane protease YdiL (CAAX protease family)